MNEELEKIRALMKQIVAEKGEDYVYPGATGGVCLYVEPDGSGPSCLVGHVLYAYGASLEELFTYEGGTPVPMRGTLVPNDEEIVEYLRIAQQVQDDGRSWGDALRAAEGYARDA